MAIEYLGLSAINGPMVVLEGVQDAAYDEIVEMTVNGNQKKLGRIIEVYKDKAIIQVFEGTEGLSLTNVHTSLTWSSDGTGCLRRNAGTHLQRYRCTD